MMRQKEEEVVVVVLYRANADWYWEMKSNSDFRVT
jgi:phenylpyruvate tautomerase PptA (4-oxalocrotonate tautomerase family)